MQAGTVRTATARMTNRVGCCSDKILTDTHGRGRAHNHARLHSPTRYSGKGVPSAAQPLPVAADPTGHVVGGQPRNTGGRRDGHRGRHKCTTLTTVHLCPLDTLPRVHSTYCSTNINSAQEHERSRVEEEWRWAAEAAKREEETRKSYEDRLK
jgi:hypothetical protein